ncbi:hypothetical protein [Yoonia sp. R2-816]|uniref:hypothetical protein n=1 Tax=Yoonia sp. R2-816 TaxID=3342638 RepID=UPI00372BEC0E
MLLAEAATLQISAAMAFDTERDLVQRPTGDGFLERTISDSRLSEVSAEYMPLSMPMFFTLSTRGSTDLRDLGDD